VRLCLVATPLLPLPALRHFAQQLAGLRLRRDPHCCRVVGRGLGVANRLSGEPVRLCQLGRPAAGVAVTGSRGSFVEVRGGVGMDIEPVVAARIVAELGAGGIEVPPLFVEDVLRRHAALGGLDQLPLDPDRRRLIARRVASALREDSDVVLRVLEAADRQGRLGVGRISAGAAVRRSRVKPPPSRAMPPAAQVASWYIPESVNWTRRLLRAQVIFGVLQAVAGFGIAALGAVADRHAHATWIETGLRNVVVGTSIAIPSGVLARLIWTQQTAVRTTIVVFESIIASLQLLLLLPVLVAGKDVPVELALIVLPMAVLAMLFQTSARAWFASAGR